jgi:hypothetical protein
LAGDLPERDYDFILTFLTTYKRGFSIPEISIANSKAAAKKRKGAMVPPDY